MFILVKPREGLRILRPDTQTVLLECGEHVPNNTFWKRRLSDGDVSIISEASMVTPKKVKEPKESKEPKEKKAIKQEADV